MRFVATLVALLCALRMARADGIGVVVTGDAARQGAVRARVEGWLRDRGMTVVAAPLSTDAVNTLTNCFTLEDLACARGVFDARARSGALVFVRIDAAGTNLTFSVYWFARGQTPIGERRVCEKCEATGWHAVTDTILQRVVGEVPASARDSGAAGDSERHGSRVGPSVLLGAGVALLATGSVFLYYGSLDGPDQKYLYPDATPAGIATGIVGLGATIGGTIWLIQTGSSSGPVASATRHGGYIGWAGHF